MTDAMMGPVILDIEGLALTQEDEEILRHPAVGGVIFFSRNYETPQQLSEVVRHIKSIRSHCLLCVDQEGGRVQRFIRHFTRLPKLKILGDMLESKNYSMVEMTKMSEKLGLLMALEVRALGVDLSFAPVLDLDRGMSDVMRDRAIHSDPTIVSTLATAYIQGMAKVGMQATGKHFPGHGAVTLDSHLTLPEDQRTLAEIAIDMQPFKTLIESGIAAIMPAHIVYPKIDPFPVGFSAYWLQSVLRQKLGFKGTIVSDDLSMEGASSIGDYPARARTALEAGCDFVLVCNNRSGAINIIENLQIQHDETSEHRRLNLLAKGEVPSWQQLAKTPLWQEAVKVIEELQIAV